MTNTNEQSGIDIPGCHMDASGYVRPGLTGKKIYLSLRLFFYSKKRKLLHEKCF